MAFLLFTAVAAGTPGPSNIILTAAGAQAGVLRGLPCLFGVTAGMGLMMFLVLSGLGSLVLVHPGVLKALNWGGAAFLLWLSWRIATSSSHIEPLPERTQVGFLGAAAFQWVNPKSWLVAASAAGTFFHPQAGSPILQAVSLGFLFFLGACPSCFLWLAFGSSLQRVLRSDRSLRMLNVLMGGLLALSVTLIVR